MRHSSSLAATQVMAQRQQLAAAAAGDGNSNSSDSSTAVCRISDAAALAAAAAAAAAIVAVVCTWCAITQLAAAPCARLHLARAYLPSHPCVYFHVHPRIDSPNDRAKKYLVNECGVVQCAQRIGLNIKA